MRKWRRHMVTRRPRADRAGITVAVWLACLVVLNMSAHTAWAEFTAEAIFPITLEVNETLRFGAFFSSAPGGSVTIAASGTPSRTSPDLTLFDSDFGAAEFRVTGDGSAAFTITLPSTVTLETGAFSMVATLSVAPGPNTTIVATGGTRDPGERFFWVGATLAVGPNQADGSYSGQFNVTVTYD